MYNHGFSCHYSSFCDCKDIQVSAGFAAGKVGNASKTLEKTNVAGKATVAADVANGATTAEITNATSLSNKILDTLTPSPLKPALSEGIDNLPKMDFKPILPESGKPLQIVKSGKGVNISGSEKTPEIGKVDSPEVKADTRSDVTKGNGKGVLSVESENISLFRQKVNTGEFSKLKESMTNEHVKMVCDDAGIDYSGIKINIIDDPDMLRYDAFGLHIQEKNKLIYILKHLRIKRS